MTPISNQYFLKKTQITYRRPPTFKNLLAPSRLKRHTVQKNIDTINKGSFRCHRSKCLCCKEIVHRAKTFSSSQTKEQFPIKHFLTCQTSYVIYLMEWQYGGRTIQKLHLRVKHRSNIRNKFLLHGFSRHITCNHPSDPTPFKIIPIDPIPPFIHNRFEQLEKREVFWIYKLRSLQPIGLNEVTEVIIS